MNLWLIIISQLATEELSEKTRDIVRALNTLKEEVEAVSWYQQKG